MTVEKQSNYGFNILDSGLAVNYAFRFLKTCFLLFLGTLEWDSAISRCPFSTTFTSRYDFSITPVFSILKLYLPISAVYSDHPSSFIHVKSNIWHLYDDLFLPSHNFFSVRCHVGLQTIIVYQRGITLKSNIGESRKKAGDSSDDFLVLVIVENRLYFLFKIYPTEKNDVTAAILRTHLWHATVRFCKSSEVV